MITRDWADDDAFNKWRISVGMTLHIEINAAWETWKHLTAAPTPPAQEDEPVAYQLIMLGVDKPEWQPVCRETYERLNGKGFEGRKLYTRPQSDNLRKAAEEVVTYFDDGEDHSGKANFGKFLQIIDSLRNALNK